jgi:hypothetical protein
MSGIQKAIKVPDRVHRLICDLAIAYDLPQSTIVDLAIRQVASGSVNIAPRICETQAIYGGKDSASGKTKKQAIKK